LLQFAKAHQMRYTFKIGSFFRIPVKIHITFPLILLVFGAEAWIRGNAWDALWAVVLVLAVFTCVVLHELGHSLQVRRYGIRVRDIVLLPIGGMARAESIPENPWHEIVVAASGPLVNLALASIFLAVILVRGTPLDFEHDFVTNLFSINIILGAFNMIPAFPMDGGRILRAVLATRMSYLAATRRAKSVGQAIALVFAVIGFANTSFIMLPVIAVVIFFGAISEENMIKMKVNLGGKPVREYIAAGVPIFDLADTVEHAASILDDESPIALPVSTADRRLPAAVLRDDLTEAVERGDGRLPLQSLLITDFPLLEGSVSALQVYSYMKAEGRAFAGVIDEGRFAGLVFLSNLSRAIA
jgi:Zn-dependent protease